MLLHVKQDGEIEFPVTVEELKKRFPLTSFCEPLTGQSGLPEGYWVVDVKRHTTPVPLPETVILDFEKPEWDGRGWVVKQTPRPYNEREIFDKKLEKRNQRNKLLQETDWTQLPDVPFQISDRYRPYRQRLRELPQNPDFPFIDFPEAP